MGRRIAGLLAAAAGLGALAGLVWFRVVDRPAYRVIAGGADPQTEALPERALASVIAADAWYAGLGLVVGVLLGALGWRTLRALGWPLVPVVVAAAAVAGLLCWQVGSMLGPGPLPPRLQAAAPGDLVPIELTVRAWPALAVWPFGAVAYVLVLASLSRDDELPDSVAMPEPRSDP